MTSGKVKKGTTPYLISPLRGGRNISPLRGGRNRGGILPYQLVNFLTYQLKEGRVLDI